MFKCFVCEGKVQFSYTLGLIFALLSSITVSYDDILLTDVTADISGCSNIARTPAFSFLDFPL